MIKYLVGGEPRNQFFKTYSHRDWRQLNWRDNYGVARACENLSSKNLTQHDILRLIYAGRSDLVKQVFAACYYLYIIALIRIKQKQVKSFVSANWMAALTRIETQLSEFVQDRYFLLLVRLAKPTDITLSVLPLLIAEAILARMAVRIRDSLDEIYGILSASNSVHLMCHEFIVNLLSGAKGLSMPLRSVDRLVDNYLHVERERQGGDWQL